MQFRPMLAAEADLKTLQYPVLASPKLDGVRALIIGGRVLSRTLKPIPNVRVQELFGRPELEGCDGELIMGEPWAKDCYRRTVSTVMSEDKDVSDIGFYIFDNFTSPTMSYLDRHNTITECYMTYIVEQDHITDEKVLLAAETEALRIGFEGLILRASWAPYKYGRSTQRQGWMLKLKRFQDAEAIVIGFTELESNMNVATTDERGYTKRSHYQDNKVPMSMLGALVVEFEGQQFSIGTGFTNADREEIWAMRSIYLGRWAKFKYLPIGMKDAPRHPVFLGWRLGD